MSSVMYRRRHNESGKMIHIAGGDGSIGRLDTVGEFESYVGPIPSDVCPSHAALCDCRCRIANGLYAKAHKQYPGNT